MAREVGLEKTAPGRAGLPLLLLPTEASALNWTAQNLAEDR